jgi:Zn-finger nucleic acid-binding protein
VSRFEARLPCPVCLGTRMEKVQAGPAGLVLDRCGRCRGVWFDHGEVQRLRSLPKAALAPRMEDASPRPALCHSCHAPLDRDAERCGGCGWVQTLDCPVCARAMRTAEQGGVRLDFCGSCRGVWFDGHEVAAAWTAGLTAAAAARGKGSALTSSGGGVDLVDVLIFAPDLVFHGAHAGAVAAGAVARGVSAAPEAALAAAEVASSAASGVFSLLVEIVGGLFDGLG